MREATARAEWAGLEEPLRTSDTRAYKQDATSCLATEGWNPERFAREQIRRLVGQVFFGGHPAQQVVFSTIDPETDIETICGHVGVALAQETTSDVAVVGSSTRGTILRGAPFAPDENIARGDAEADNQRRNGLQNLWFLPAREGGAWDSKAPIKTYLEDIRREFKYSIVQAPSVMNSDESLSLAESADGLILVLSARRTRRRAALRIREMLAVAQLRLLGTVLSDREFPIPEKIYRRL